ncbi:MAG TPA: hypothetical protein VFB32_01405 [Rudaea sp.]|nr:hypothetical protein [Rudaea sp.]
MRRAIRHPRAVEYAEQIVRYVERRATMLRELAALPEAAAFALDVLALVAELDGAIAYLAQALPNGARQRGGACG